MGIQFYKNKTRNRTIQETDRNFVVGYSFWSKVGLPHQIPHLGLKQWVQTTRANKRFIKEILNNTMTKDSV